MFVDALGNPGLYIANTKTCSKSFAEYEADQFTEEKHLIGLVTCMINPPVDVSESSNNNAIY